MNRNYLTILFYFMSPMIKLNIETIVVPITSFSVHEPHLGSRTAFEYTAHMLKHAWNRFRSLTCIQSVTNNPRKNTNHQRNGGTDSDL